MKISIKVLTTAIVISSLTGVVQAMRPARAFGQPINPNARNKVQTVITAEDQVQALNAELEQVKAELAETQGRLAKFQREATRQTMANTSTEMLSPIYRKRVTAPEETTSVSTSRPIALPYKPFTRATAETSYVSPTLTKGVSSQPNSPFVETEEEVMVTE